LRYHTGTCAVASQCTPNSVSVSRSIVADRRRMMFRGAWPIHDAARHTAGGAVTRCDGKYGQTASKPQSRSLSGSSSDTPPSTVTPAVVLYTQTCVGPQTQLHLVPRALQTPQRTESTTYPNGTCPVVSFSCTWYRAAVTRPTHRHSLCATQSPSRNREIGDTCDTSTSFTCRESRRKRGRVPAQVWASLGARCGRVSAHHARAPLPSAEPERREFQLHLHVCHRAERGERIAAESYRVACAATHSAVRSDATAPQVKYPEYSLSLEYPRSLERHPQP